MFYLDGTQNRCSIVADVSRIGYQKDNRFLSTLNLSDPMINFLNLPNYNKEELKGSQSILYYYDCSFLVNDVWANNCNTIKFKCDYWVKYPIKNEDILDESNGIRNEPLGSYTVTSPLGRIVLMRQYIKETNAYIYIFVNPATLKKIMLYTFYTEKRIVDFLRLYQSLSGIHDSVCITNRSVRELFRF